MSAGKAPAHILVVDDDPAVRLLLRDCFELEGYRVSEAKDGSELTVRMAQDPVDLITLDINLGGENGFDIARRVRASQNVPIVMITGKGDVIDRILGLELGADDYIHKPFHVREVLARVRAVLRRYEGAAHSAHPASTTTAVSDTAPHGERFAFAGWLFDTASRVLKSEAGEARDLTTAEYNMLEMFVHRPSRVLSRDNIMDLLKGHEWSPYDRSIDSLVVRLRKKIEPEPENPQLIKTVRGVGYVFAAHVEKR